MQEPIHPSKTEQRAQRKSALNLSAKRKKAVNTAIRHARDKLASDSDLPMAFERDMILAHVRNYRTTTFVVPAMILFIGLPSLGWNSYFAVMIWMIVALSVHALLYFQNSRFLTVKNENPNQLQACQRKLIQCDLLSGLVWASYLLLPLDNGLSNQTVFVFSTFLIVIALFSFTMAPLFIGMLAATTPITMMIFAKFINFGSSTLIVMAGLFVTAQLLFILVGRQIQKALQNMFTIKAEKDNLILDLEEAQALSEEARRRSEEANLAKSRFLATMSHELRTPLNAILGFSEIIKEEILGPINNPSYKEYVTDINSSGQHLLNLINEILDLSRVEAGKYELSETPISVVDVVEDCQALMQVRSKSKEITLSLITEENMPRVWADERAIRQIVLNLMSNAVKFTPKGGGISINVGWTSGGGQYISVTDTGPGIPEEEIPIVLSQFGQGSLAIKSAEQGTGLGLPIVQALINMHGGIFDLKSKLRQGTSVTVTLPRSRVMEALAPVATTSNTQSNSTSSQDHSALLKAG